MSSRPFAAIVTVMLLALVVPTGGVTANGVGNDPCDLGVQGNTKTVVDNEDVRIWFQGIKGHLKLFQKNDTTGAVEAEYDYSTRAITELDEDGEPVAWFNYNRAQPKNSECTVVEDDTYLNITFVVTDTVDLAQGGSTGEEARIAFDYHFNKDNRSSKFDLNVQDWPWQAEGMLTYDFEVTATGWDIETAENGLGFQDNETGEREAFIEWAPNATAYYDDGHNETAVVDSSTTQDNPHHASVNLAFTMATPGYLELDYDPTVGLGPYLIVAGILVPVEPLIPLPEPLDDVVSVLV